VKNDLTQGGILKTLVMFSKPLVLSGLLQQLYNWADAFIVGNVEGELPLAAIGATGSISALLVMIITGFTVGIAIVAAHLYGAGKKDRITYVLSSFSLTLGGFFLVAAVAGILFTPSILRLLNTPDDIFSLACEYLRIIFVGVPFIVVYNVHASVLRGMGDSRAPFFAIVVSALANVLLDLLLVAVYRYGVAGAAVATVVSQVMMTLFVVVYSNRKYPFLLFNIEKKAIDRNALIQGLRLSIPTATQSSVHSVGNLVLQNFMNGFGTQTVAAITTAYRIDTIIMLPLNNLGEGISTVTAQNIGAGNRKRAKKSLLVGIMLTAAVALALTALVIPTGGSLIAMFGVRSEAVEIGKKFFHIIAVFYLPYGVAMALRGYLQGIGDVVFSAILSLTSLVVRIVLSYAFWERTGNAIIAYAEAVSWMVLLIMCLIRFLQVSRSCRVVEDVVI